MTTNLTPSGADFKPTPKPEAVGPRQTIDSARAQEARTGCADGGCGHYDPCECPRKPLQGLVTLDRPIRLCGRSSVPATHGGTELAGRVERALAILRSPGDLDTHIQEVGGLLFPSLRDNRERDRRASRFLLCAILSGATSAGRAE